MTYQSVPQAFIQTNFGVVKAVFTGGDHVYVVVESPEGQAHINDNRPGLVFRGQEYIGSVHFFIDGDGQLVANLPSLSRRPQWTDAPRTHRDAMVKDIQEALQLFVNDNPELLATGARAKINNHLETLQDKRTKARQELADINAEITDKLRQLAAFNQEA